MFETDPTAHSEIPPGDLSADLTGPAGSEALLPPACEALNSAEIDDLVEDAVHASNTENAARLVLLRTVARLNAVEVWKADGQMSMASWVAWKFHCSRRTARELVAVARVIDVRPALAAAYAEGRLSWDQLVPLCTLSTRDNDRGWARQAHALVPEDLLKMVRSRELTTERARDIHAQRSVTARPHGSGGTEVRVVLENSNAETVIVELDRIREQEAVPDPGTGKYPRVAQQRADALVSLARRGLGADGDVDRATVVLHAPVETITEGADTAGHLTDGTPVAAETIRRLACDARIEIAVHGPDGVVLGIGRASRTWPAWLARQIKHRDRGRCRFPGCPNPIHHIHHCAEWDAHQGRTDSRNGVGSCWGHHHLVHEGGWTVTGNADILATFTSPDGRVFESPVPASAAELWEPAA